MAKKQVRTVHKRMVRAQTRAELTDIDESKRQFLATVLTYNTLDDYRTEFDPNIFVESIAQRMPRICWSHDWSDLIGLAVDHENDQQRLRFVGQLSKFEAVPRAYQAWEQMQDGTIDQFSVGFWLLAEEESVNFPGATLLLEGQLDEFSPVLAGAVTGTSLDGMRGRQLVMLRNKDGKALNMVVDADLVAKMFAQLAIGDIDLADGLAAIKSNAIPADKVQASSDDKDDDQPSDDKNDDKDDDDSDDKNDDKKDDDESEPKDSDDDIDADALEADLDAALSKLG